MQYFRDMAVNPLLLTGFVGGLLAAFACGVMGPYVVSRRIVFLVGAIAHIVVGGIGAALFLHHRVGWTWLDPVHGAVVAALVAAVIVGLVEHYARERLDTLIGALWAVGMAFGLLLVKYTPGYHTELFSYLFGNLAVVDAGDVTLLVVLDAVILLAVLVHHKQFQAIVLDEEFARIQGAPVLRTKLVLLALVSLAVVAMMQVVGLILVIALLSLPAALAGRWTGRLAPMIVVSTLLCLVLVTFPRIAVYGTRTSPEAAIVLAAGALYLATIGIRSATRR